MSPIHCQAKKKGDVNTQEQRDVIRLDHDVRQVFCSILWLEDLQSWRPHIRARRGGGVGRGGGGAAGGMWSGEPGRLLGSLRSRRRRGRGKKGKREKGMEPYPLTNLPPFLPRPPNPADYRIYSINRPGRLLNFWTLRVGAYSRLSAYWLFLPLGWALTQGGR